MPKVKFSVGDKVRRWTSLPNRKLGKEIWTVEAIYDVVASQSGILLDVFIPECPHCGANKRTIKGYDSDWFEKVIS